MVALRPRPGAWYYLQRLLHPLSRPMWPVEMVEQAMAAGELTAGPDWRDTPEGEAAFVRVMARELRWVHYWRRRG